MRYRYILIGLVVFVDLVSSCDLAHLRRAGGDHLGPTSVATPGDAPAPLAAGFGIEGDFASWFDDAAVEDVDLDVDLDVDWDSTRLEESDRLESSVVAWPTGTIAAVPGEFRHQAALLLGCQELEPVAPDVLVSIVEAACGQIPVVAVVGDDVNRDYVVSTLERHHLPADSVHFVEAPHNTMWIRDYGPVVTTTSSGSQIVLNAEYSDDERPADDNVPTALARVLGIPCVAVPFEMDGGNLLSNGEGLCLSTRRLLEDNDMPEPELRQMLRRYYGCDRTVFLEPLAGEDTGHVDMFATFTAPDTIVVGEYADGVDAANRDVLERNVETLSRVRTPRGGLNVVRIPMPDLLQEQRRTYTNVIYANGKLLVPVYSDDAEEVRERVLRTFSSLLPDWDIVAVESDTLTVGGGALHCVSRNVAFLGELGLKPSECVSTERRENGWAPEDRESPAWTGGRLGAKARCFLNLEGPQGTP